MGTVITMIVAVNYFERTDRIRLDETVRYDDNDDYSHTRHHLGKP